MKIRIKIIIAWSYLLVFSYLLYCQTNNQRIMNWIKSKNINTIPTNISNDMINDLNIIYNNLPEVMRLNQSGNCNLTNIEANYYFVDNSYNNPSRNNDDYITIKNIYTQGNHHTYAQICDNNWWWFNCWTIENEERFTNSYSYYFDIDSNTTNRSFHGDSPGWSFEHHLTKKGNVWISHWVDHGYWWFGTWVSVWVDEGGFVYFWQEHSNEDSTRSADFMINQNSSNTTTPMVTRNTFLDYPRMQSGELIPRDSWNRRPGPGEPGDNPSYYSYWNNFLKITYMYYAKSPTPRILTQNSTPDTPIHINTAIMGTNITTDQHVKIMEAAIYKDNGNNIYTKKKSITKSITEQEDILYGINNWDISADFYNSLYENSSDEGTYNFVFSCIDKFNKIYFFSPEKFVIDRTKPIVNGLEFKIPTPSTPVILKWDSISDNLTKDWAEKDFIYIRLGGTVKDVTIDSCGKFIVDAQNKEIRIKSEGTIVIQDLFIQDKAGNRVDIASNIVLNWDHTPPVIRLDNTNDLIQTHDSNQMIRLIVDDASDVKIDELKINFNGVDYPLASSNDYSSTKIFDIPLTVLAGKEGSFKILIGVEDEAHNISNAEFNFNIDASYPMTEIFFNDNTYDIDIKLIYLNHSNQMYIKVADLNFDYFDLNITSELSGSSNILSLSHITQADSRYNSTAGKFYIEDLNKSANVSAEKISIKLSTFDKIGHNTIINGQVKLYDDNSSPFIHTTRIEEGKYQIEVSDDSIIDKIYIKYIDLPSDNSVDINNFNPLPPDSSWLTLASNVSLYNKINYILPRYAACIFAKDIWGNMSDSNSVGIILENQMPASTFIINSKADLDLIGWSVYGSVLFRTSITVEPTEILNIVTNSSGNTNVDFDASVGQIKITNNGGVININSTNNEIRFRGAGASTNDYAWFGFQNVSGDLNFTGSNKIYFINAVNPISYLNPPNDINLQNMEFDDCMFGIHLIDQCLSYNHLNLDTVIFNNLVYGVKFDVDSYINISNFINGLPYLNQSNCLFNNITKGNVYDPVFGVYTKPIVVNFKLQGYSTIGDTITASYNFLDPFGNNEGTSIYKWYHRFADGSWEEISGANGISYVIDNTGQYRFSVTPVDDKGNIGRPTYIDSKIVY